MVNTREGKMPIETKICEKVVEDGFLSDSFLSELDLSAQRRRPGWRRDMRAGSTRAILYRLGKCVVLDLYNIHLLYQQSDRKETPRLQNTDLQDVNNRTMSQLYFRVIPANSVFLLPRIFGIVLVKVVRITILVRSFTLAVGTTGAIPEMIGLTMHTIGRRDDLD
jgi:hypothetical protein